MGSAWKSTASIVKSGYPGGCAIPVVHPATISSPLSPPGTCGYMVRTYTVNTAAETSIPATRSPDCSGAPSRGWNPLALSVGGVPLPAVSGPPALAAAGLRCRIPAAEGDDICFLWLDPQDPAENRGGSTPRFPTPAVTFPTRETCFEILLGSTNFKLLFTPPSTLQPHQGGVEGYSEWGMESLHQEGAWRRSRRLRRLCIR